MLKKEQSFITKCTCIHLYSFITKFHSFFFYLQLLLLIQTLLNNNYKCLTTKNIILN